MSSPNKDRPHKSGVSKHDADSIAEIIPDENASTTVVQAVAAVTNRELTALPPLYHAIDADALDRLDKRAVSSSQSVAVTFAYADCRVTVETADEVRVACPSSRH